MNNQSDILLYSLIVLVILFFYLYTTSVYKNFKMKNKIKKITSGSCDLQQYILDIDQLKNIINEWYDTEAVICSKIENCPIWLHEDLRMADYKTLLSNINREHFLKIFNRDAENHTPCSRFFDMVNLVYLTLQPETIQALLSRFINYHIMQGLNCEGRATEKDILELANDGFEWVWILPLIVQYNKGKPLSKLKIFTLNKT